MKLIFTLSILLLPASLSFAYESMYDKTPVGKIVILDLPERISLEASTKSSYFREDNGLFRKLFRYISKNDISMTTPVEAEIQPGKMRFFVGSDDQSKRFKSSKEVSVKKIPTKKVISIGIRGSYSEKNFTENLKKLHYWLSQSKSFKASGQPYAVYWHGPFVPGPFKRSEIHLPVELTQSKTLKSQN